MYNFIEHIKLFDAESLGASLTSAPIKIKTASRFSIHLVLTGAPAGSFKVQASNIPTAEGATVAARSSTGTPSYVSASLNTREDQ